MFKAVNISHFAGILLVRRHKPIQQLQARINSLTSLVNHTPCNPPILLQKLHRCFLITFHLFIKSWGDLVKEVSTAVEGVHQIIVDCCVLLRKIEHEILNPSFQNPIDLAAAHPIHMYVPSANLRASALRGGGVPAPLLESMYVSPSSDWPQRVARSWKFEKNTTNKQGCTNYIAIVMQGLMWIHTCDIF